MYNNKLEDKLFLLAKAEDFAHYYSKRIKDDLKEDAKRTTLILIRDFTPIFILGFASFFDNVRIILTQNYDFEHDIMFNMKNTNRASILTTYIKALYYKAPKLKTLIRQGYKLQESDLNFNTKDYNQKRISVKNYTVGFDLDQYVARLEGFPALVIDARIFENTVKEIRKNESDIVLFYTNLITVKKESEELKDDTLDKMIETIREKNEELKKDPNPFGTTLPELNINRSLVKQKKNNDKKISKKVFGKKSAIMTKDEKDNKQLGQKSREVSETRKYVLEIDD